MKVGILPLCVVAVAALALGAVTTACDGDGGGELTLAEYFERLGQLSTDADDRSTDLEDQFDEDTAAAESEEDALEASRDLYAGGASLLKDLVDGLDDLDPPAEAAEAHSKLVEAGRNMVEAFEDAVKQFDDAESAADMEAALTGDFGTLNQKFQQPCVDLLAIAEENNIETELVCED